MMKNYLKVILFLCMGIALTNCEGEDGAAGLDGINGADGTNGTNGVDGTNGVGFDELTKYGSVSATLTGTRVDNIDFTQTTDFKFVPVDANDIFSSNSIIDNGDRLDFRIQRFISAPDDIYQLNTVNIDLTVNDPGLETQSLDFSIGFVNHAVVGEDLKYFVFSDFFSGLSLGVSNLSITDYSFDDTTNELTFSYSFDVDALNNSTGNALTISGDVNVIVLERVSAIVP